MSDRVSDSDRATVNELATRLNDFRRTCRPTTLAEIDRDRRSPFQLLVSCIISLRTKDEVTAAASARLLALADTAEQLQTLPEETIASAVYPAGFYRTKARQLKELARLLVERHGARVPGVEQELLALPGVGRKTANLVLGLGFGVPAICVDTHVHRISNRLGLVRTTTPEKTERGLQDVLPQDLWIPINDLMVTFGQNRCHPTSPRCTGCPLTDLCPRIGVTRFR
jgi:endonuclease-3